MESYTLWTPQLADELLYREYLQGEDVKALIPPAPPVGANENLPPSSSGGKQRGNDFHDFSDATKAMAKFLNNNGNNNATCFSPSTSPKAISNASSPRSQQFIKNGCAANTFNSAYVAQPLHQKGGGTPSSPKPSSMPPPPCTSVNSVHGVVGSSSPHHVMSTVPVTATADISSQNSGPVSMVAGCKKVTVDWTKTSIASNAVLSNTAKQIVQYVIQHTKKEKGEKSRPIFPASSQLTALTEARIIAQEGVDPDLFFQQPEEDFPLESIFARYPKALQFIANSRGLSGDWQTDTFNAAEEAAYKKDENFRFIGASQAQSLQI